MSNVKLQIWSDQGGYPVFKTADGERYEGPVYGEVYDGPEDDAAVRTITECAWTLAEETARHRREYDSGEARDLSKKVERLAELVAELSALRDETQS